MNKASSFRNPYARQKPGGAGTFALAHDHFRDQAGGKPAPKTPKGDAFARPPSAPKVVSAAAEKPVEPGPAPERKPILGVFGMRPRPIATPPETFDDEFRRELVEERRPRPSTGPSLRVVTRDGDVDLDQTIVHGGDRLILRRPGQKSTARPSSLVLVSGGNTVAAAEAVVDADFEEGFADDKPKRERRVRSGGGGGGSSGGSGGGGIKPPTAQIDRAFNQDDLVSILIVLALLLLFGMFLIRGNGAPSQPQQLASVQSAAVEPAKSEPVGPPPDPYGDKPRVFVPAPVAPAPAPAPACTAGHTMRAWFCTNEAQLTDKAKVALAQELKDWNACFQDRELVVAGYADTRGSPEYNAWLGGERAKTIADYLRSQGIKVAALTPVGELDGLADNENCSNQRRVDIMFKGEEAEPPSRSCAPPADFAELVCG
jgi:outer membrane protein OmpA-like peptidoglycan-associated protein